MMITEIINRGWAGIDPTEAESAEIKGWLRDTIIQLGTTDMDIFMDIQILFPIEYGEYLDEKQNDKV